MFNDSHPFCSGCQFYFPSSLTFSLRNTDFPHSPLFNIFFCLPIPVCFLLTCIVSLLFFHSLPELVSLSNLSGRVRAGEAGLCFLWQCVMFLLIPLSVWSRITSDSLYCLQSPSVIVYLCVRRSWGIDFSHTCCINMRKTHKFAQEFSACMSSQDCSSARCTLSHLQVCARMISVYSAAAAAPAETLGLSLLHYRWGSCEQHVCFLN